MAIQVKHSKVSTIPDTDDTSLVRPSDWNADHVLTGTIPVANGGTGADNPTDARTNLSAAKSGANSDITSMTGVTGGISSPDYIQFDTTYATPLTQGQLGWDGNNTLALGMAGNNVIQHIGEDSFIYIKADAAITKGQVIMFTGAVGASGVLTGAPATGVTNPQYIMGIAAEDLAHNAFGLVQTFGELTGINTNSFNEGDVLYYDSAVTGGLTNVFPTSGPIVLVAAVAKKASGNGTLVIRVSVTQRITAGAGATITQANTGTTVAVTNPYNPASVAITGGTINGTTIGATTPSTGTFTTITGQTEVLATTGNNLFARSQTFNTHWTSGGANITATDNAVTAPDSTTTAANIVPTVTNGLHRISNPSTLTLYAGVTYTSSIYAKANGYRYLFINHGSGIAASSVFDLQAGTVSVSTGSATITSAGSGWYRCTVTGVAPSTGVPGLYWQFNTTYAVGDQSFAGDGTSSIYFWGGQLEIGSSATTYVPTTTAGIWNVPSLSFASTAASRLGLQSDGSLFLQPAGTGAIQAQATTSTATGGNARGANAVDWQTTRSAANQVASSAYSTIGGGSNNRSAGSWATIGGGYSNVVSGNQTLVFGGSSNTASLDLATIGGGFNNTAAGYFNFIGAGYGNSGTSGSAVTTQSGTMNGTTAVTLSGSNASIKVGQLITGTSIASYTYVAAISGTSLTLSQAASGSSTSTLSFFTPHGVVVGGGNNQATGAYSFIGGGGDAGTAANRNVASGAWSAVVGGNRNTASGLGSFVGGNGGDGAAFYPNTASGISSAVVCGTNNTASGNFSFIGAGISHTNTGSYGFIGGGIQNTVNSIGAIAGGVNGTIRSIIGNHVFPACSSPIASASGVSQAALLILGVQTTDATATALRSDSSAASGTNQVILPNNSAYYFTGEIVSGVTGGGNSKGWEISGLIKRGANAAATTLVGSTVTSLYADAGAATWTIALAADTTNGGLRVTFTGQAATTIRTVCQIRTTEMTY